MEENEKLGNLVPTRGLGWTSKIFHTHPPVAKSMSFNSSRKNNRAATASHSWILSRRSHAEVAKMTDFQKCEKKAV